MRRKIKWIFIIIVALLTIIFTYFKTYNSYHTYWWYIQSAYLQHKFAANPQAKTRVAFVTHNLSLAGAPIMIARLAKLLKQNNYNVAVLYWINPAIADSFHAADIPTFEARMSSLNYDQYIKFLKKHFDVVIVSGDQSLYEHDFIYEHIPTVFWLHEVNSWLESFQMVMTTDSFAKSLDGIFNPLRALKAADIVTVSNYVKKSLQKYPERPIEVIYNAVGYDEVEQSMQKGSSALYQQLMRAKKNKTMFVLVGRICQEKGVHVLLKAIRKLPPEYQQKSLFYIIGMQDRKYVDKLKKKYKHLQNVIYTGTLHGEDLNDYYRSADVMLVPSIIPDSAPCVVTEAALYHVPSIISDTVGSDYLIKDQQSGLVVKAKSSNDLRDKIMYFIDHPEQIVKMGDAAYQEFLNTSTTDVFFKRWDEKIQRKLHEK